MRTNWPKIMWLVIFTCLLGLNLLCVNARALEVIQVKKTEIPVVYFKVMIHAGSAYDPPGKEGLSYFTAQMIQRGTQSFSRDQMDDLLDYLSGRLNVGVHKEVIVISGTTLKENLDKFYQVFSEVILKPTFPEDQVEKTRIDQLDAIENLRQDDVDLVKESFDDYIFRGHPYGHPVYGKESSVKSLTLQDALDFYNRYYVQDNLLLGLAGDFDETLVERFKKDMSALKTGKTPKPERNVQSIVGRKVLLIEKEGRTQNQIRIGHPYFISRSSSDYFPLLVANVYLGKHRESIGQLYKTVRMQRGLSYGAYSYIEHFEQSGWSKLAAPNIPRDIQYFSMWTYVKSPNTKFAIKLLLRDMSDLALNGISQDRLQLTKDFEANQYPFQIETPERKLGLLLDDKFYGTPGFVDNYEKNVEKVTREEINRTAATYLSPGNVAIVVMVSDPEKFKQQLLSDQTNVEYPSQFDTSVLESEDALIKAFDLKLKDSDFEIVKASELFK
ncbi:MAG: pitrilysin family protein [Candidatus Zixiibacteriota bacterium]